MKLSFSKAVVASLSSRALPLVACLSLGACAIRQMTSTVHPPSPGDMKLVHGSVSHLMSAKSAAVFPAESSRTRSYTGHRIVYPSPVHMPAPPYPVIYQPIASEKDVWVSFVVDQSGRVTKAKCLDAKNSYLNRVVERTVNNWNFYPGTVDGMPEEFLLSVAIKFRFDGPGV